MAVKDSIPSKQLFSPSNLEVVTICLESRKPITLCSVYCAPNSGADYQLMLIEYLHGLVESCGAVIIMGDFNVPDINWSSLCGSSTFSNALGDFIFENNLSQLVLEQTHIKGMDLVITNKEDSIKYLHLKNYLLVLTTL